jgi:hypothetical protein
MSSVGSIFFDEGSVYSGPEPSLILTGSFTIEFWFRSGSQSQAANSAIAQAYHGGNGIDIRINASIQLLPNLGNPPVLYESVRSNINDDQWHNVAIVQDISNTTLSLFIDGVKDGETTTMLTWDFGTYGISLGLNPGYASTWNGYLSNIRIVNGTALYSSNYSIPTTTYTSIPNTVFLFNASSPNNFVDNSPNRLAMTASGAVFVSTTITPNITQIGNTNPNWVPCFNENTKILCLIDDIEVYVPIQNIRKGFLIKTYSSGYKSVTMIGSRKIYNPDNDLRSKDRLYRLANSEYPEIFEDLILTGCHSILEDDLTEDQQKNTIDDIGRLLITESKYRLFTYLDDRATPYEKEGIYTIWHIALEHEDTYMNYGIYANGLLVESISNRMMKNFSGMKLV